MFNSSFEILKDSKSDYIRGARLIILSVEIEFSVSTDKNKVKSEHLFLIDSMVGFWFILVISQQESSEY